MAKKKNENAFQQSVIKSLNILFPDAIILKTDPSYIQGIPDLLILVGERWFALEVKKDRKSKFRPNQQYYVSLMNRMSFARVIYPENQKEVENEICRAFRTKGKARDV